MRQGGGLRVEPPVRAAPAQQRRAFAGTGYLNAKSTLRTAPTSPSASLRMEAVRSPDGVTAPRERRRSMPSAKLGGSSRSPSPLRSAPPSATSATPIGRKAQNLSPVQTPRKAVGSHTPAAASLGGSRTNAATHSGVPRTGNVSNCPRRGAVATEASGSVATDCGASCEAGSVGPRVVLTPKLASRLMAELLEALGPSSIEAARELVGQRWGFESTAEMTDCIEAQANASYSCKGGSIGGQP